MAFKTHHRVTFGGGLAETNPFAPDEIWACNVNVTGQNAEDFDEEEYLDAITPKLATWFHSSASAMSNQATLAFVKCNQISPAGLYTSNAVTHRRDLSPVVNGSSAPVDPDIISVATSWTTDVKRGPGAHGRIYLPNATLGPSGRMLLGAADQGTLAAAGAALLDILNNADGSGPTLFPVVASKANGTNTTITGVRVGNVKDVQRRRKYAIRETYVSLAAVPKHELIEN